MDISIDIDEIIDGVVTSSEFERAILGTVEDQVDEAIRNIGVDDIDDFDGRVEDIVRDNFDDFEAKIETMVDDKIAEFDSGPAQATPAQQDVALTEKVAALEERVDNLVASLIGATSLLTALLQVVNADADAK